MSNAFESGPGVEQLANELVTKFTEQQDVPAEDSGDAIRQFWGESVPEALRPSVLEQLKKMGRTDVAEFFEKSKV